ncbi:hypothetical protein HWV62_45358 [Athelia sp. TMB]|nr:hypothetical protein HWV62_45358 [Athelia sp. TMB]
MKFTLATVIAALPFLVAAAPTSQTSPLKIGLSKRSILTRQDGTADVVKLQASVAGTMAKIQRGFAAYEQNTGSKHPLDTSASPTRRATGNDALTNDNSVLWYGRISVGTPAKTFTVDFDTGSSDLFLPGPNCGSSCEGHTTYNPGTSSSSNNLGRSFSLEYGDGSTVSGTEYTDTVTITGLTAIGQTLGAAKTYSESFESDNFPADGLLGMGFESISSYGASPVFQTMVDQGAASDAVFAFKLASSGSELTLGGTDPSLYTGDFTYVPVTDKGYWQVELGGLSVNNKPVFSLGPIASIIDTGTTLIIGDTARVTEFYSQVSGAKELGDGMWSVPCNAIPQASLTFGGQKFAISSSAFNLGQVTEGSSDCVGGLTTNDEVAAEFWVVGDVFLQNVYTAFDVANARVGFAQLA